MPLLWNVNHILFQHQCTKCAWQAMYIELGPANPCPSAVPMEPFSASTLKGYIRVFATSTKIRSWIMFIPGLHHYHLNYAQHHPTHHWYNSIIVSMTSDTHFSAIRFRGRLIRQVSCYTLLSKFQLPWPPSCCQYESTPFVISPERVCLAI